MAIPDSLLAQEVQAPARLRGAIAPSRSARRMWWFMSLPTIADGNTTEGRESLTRTESRPEPAPSNDRESAMRLSLVCVLVAATLCTGACRTTRSNAPPARSAKEGARAFVARLLGERHYRECPDDKCMRGAFAECALAHLEQRNVTIEGDPVTFDYFIVPGASGCRVELVRDYSSDRWGGCQMDRLRCGAFEAAFADDPVGRGCVQGEVLFRASNCPTPGIPNTPRCPIPEGQGPESSSPKTRD